MPFVFRFKDCAYKFQNIYKFVKFRKPKKTSHEKIIRREIKILDPKAIQIAPKKNIHGERHPRHLQLIQRIIKKHVQLWKIIQRIQIRHIKPKFTRTKRLDDHMPAIQLLRQHNSQ